MIAELTDQKKEVKQTLDDMLRERSYGKGPALITANVNIAIGKKL